MKRIWVEVAAVPLAAGFGITLDGKPLKKPSGGVLTVPYLLLTEAIAEEWRQAGLDNKTIAPDDLPLTRLAITAQDRVPHARGELIRQLAAYGMHDMLCYRTDMPVALAAREHEQWQPWLDWAARTYELHLLTGTDVTPVTQPPGTFEKCIRVLDDFDEFEIAALGVAVPALGSLILGLALATRAVDVDTAFSLAMLDEMFQAQQWGVDEEAEKRFNLIKTDLELCQRFMELCKQ